ncbi:MAG: hypothetical protein AAFY07_04425 [Pseudomonadota bacterium]
MTDTRTRPMAKALSVGLALGLALAGCKDEAEETGAVQSGGQAAGEVLGGTISDDMLPLEQLTSTSPLAPRETVTQTISEGEDGSLSVETTIERTQGTQSAPLPTAPALVPPLAGSDNASTGADSAAGGPPAAPTVAPALVPAPQPPDPPAQTGR